MIGKSGKKFKNLTNDSNRNNVILLLDSKPKIEQIHDIINQINPIIITFDYDTHKLLLDNNINHQISDDFITDDDLNHIQQSSLHFAKWSTQEPIFRLLQHDQINLGELSYIEFHYLLVPFLKKFLEVSKIFSKFTSSNFFASSLLYEIITNFTDNTVDAKIKPNVNNKFLYDVVNINPKIGNKFFSINIKRLHYQKAKEISEKIIHYLFGVKNDVSKKYVLFVEFDTIKYKEIFSTLPQTSVNLMYFGRRRPAIWNYKSFSIIRKSGCKIATLYDVMSKKSDFGLNIDEIIEEKIRNLLQQEIFFKNFFSFFDISFWNCLKPLFLDLCKKRFYEAIFEIEIAKQLFKKYTFKSVVIWSESGFNEQIIIQVAKKFKIPIVLIQHGMSWETPEVSHVKDFDGVSATKSDKFLVWGEILDNYSKKHGVKSEKLEILGSPFYDELFRKTESTTLSSNDFILLATSSPVKNNVHDLKIKTISEYEHTIQQICEIISKQNEKLVIKLHPFQDELNIIQIVKRINPEISVIKSGNILPLLESCKLLITIDLSTTILEAQILKKPVVSIPVKNYGWGNAIVFSSGSCLETNINNLDSLLTKIFHNEEFRQEMIQKGNSFVKSYLSHQGNSSKAVLSFLEKFS